jgi:hypothetical protein
VQIVSKSGSLNILELSGPVQGLVYLSCTWKSDGLNKIFKYIQCNKQYWHNLRSMQHIKYGTDCFVKVSCANIAVYKKNFQKRGKVLNGTINIGPKYERKRAFFLMK